jgi:hypothetical protein
MSRNGSGTYTMPANTWNDAAANTTIDPTDWNATAADIEAALTASIANDGQTTASAVIPFAQGIKTDTIAENTSNTGVTIDSVLAKDGRIDTSQGSDIASASTINLETATGNVVDVTGTTTVTAVTLSQGHWRVVRFTGILTLTHSASLVLPDARDHTMVAGDYWLFIGYASSVVRGAPLVKQGIQRWKKGADVASASTLTLGNDGNYFEVTGVVGITQIAAKGIGTVVKLRFVSTVNLTNSADLVTLGGGTGLTTAAGDEAEFIEYAAGDWRMIRYTPAAQNPTYQEGSFTPTIAGASTAGTQTYSSQIGRYIQIGNLVHVWIRVVMTAKDGATAGDIQVRGLPFTSSTITGIRYPATVEYANLDLTAGKTQVVGLIASNVSVMTLAEVGDNVADANLAAAALQSASEVAIYGCYRIN